MWLEILYIFAKLVCVKNSNHRSMFLSAVRDVNGNEVDKRWKLES